VGFLDRLKAYNDPAVKQWRAEEERWARILEIERVGPVARLRIELHFSNLPVKERTITSRIPRGIEPRVGQDVAYHEFGGGGNLPPRIVIDWHDAPQYGAPVYDPNAVAEQVRSQILASPTSGVTSAASSADLQQAELIRLRDAGAISAAEFDEKQADLKRWVANPEQENDPQFQLQRLERRHVAGELSDADYAQRKADIENWIENLKRIG
jgi:hypothetical protein